MTMKKSFFDTMTNNTNNNSFTSLENITLLINRLVNSENNNVLPLKYISKLVNDFSNLLKESDHYNKLEQVCGMMLKLLIPTHPLNPPRIFNIEKTINDVFI